MELRRLVTYIDPQGKDHDALVVGINQTHDGYISVAYVADVTDGVAQSDIKFAFDIPHMSDPSRQEMRTVSASNQVDHPGKNVVDGNPDLPSYVLNCWKEDGDHHVALPADHPAFDTPFAWPKPDEHGNFPVVSRKDFEAHKAAWQQYCAAQAGQPSAADLDTDAADKAAAAATGGTSSEPDVTAQLDAAGAPPAEPQGEAEPPVA